jgi:hypothetical protein
LRIVAFLMGAVFIPPIPQSFQEAGPSTPLRFAQEDGARGWSSRPFALGLDLDMASMVLS